MAPTLTVALVHHPVLDRRGDEIASTVDHFDVMDASRLSLTYPLRRIYVVNPVPAQRALVERLIAHGNAAADRDEARGAFSKTAWAPDLETVVGEHEDELGVAPTVVATSARASGRDLGFGTVRRRLHDGEAMLLLVGKAWGLAPRVLEQADVRLEPIDAGTGFNHLSVRSALAILLDRLLAPA
ncbi:RNA methyltransferase [Paraliomyxa miuraensis]|uniref:RNA methyltransferase n=1 Tax=Paraliomyxa miuraensis TaxID=376150 RepID=UPI00225B15E5|nr:RNA methyltransferase [Paraliomyxa miuraensis]MCX4242611.1 RNA methyltransferase [Paraliomyxa miuraensis]